MSAGCEGYSRQSQQRVLDHGSLQSWITANCKAPTPRSPRFPTLLLLLLLLLLLPPPA